MSHQSLRAFTEKVTACHERGWYLAITHDPKCPFLKGGECDCDRGLAFLSRPITDISKRALRKKRRKVHRQ